MEIGGPLAHRSRQPPVRLTEDEEAVLAFAACGVTGHALIDLEYQPGGGGTIVAGTLGRTVASGDAIHTVRCPRDSGGTWSSGTRRRRGAEDHTGNIASETRKLPVEIPGS